MKEHVPKSKVELHVHLDGAVRPSTVFDVARRRGMKLPVDSVEELTKVLTMSLSQPHDLKHFLSLFAIFMPVLAGDEEALKRVAYEYCEDRAKDGVIYSEVRYCPHLFANTEDCTEFTSPGKLSPQRVVTLINEALKEGCRVFGTQVRSILCCMRHRPEWSEEILKLCVEFRDAGVVGIDIAGAESITESDGPTDPEHIRVFKEAARLGIHRTVHAGENGPPANIVEAIQDMMCQRIGHGYHAVDDEDLYQSLLENDMHFEVCPYSSIVTGSVNSDLTLHPLKRFAEDNANFSLSTDDPTITSSSLTDEYVLVTKKMGLTRKHIQQANLNAARSAFLPNDEKNKLVNILKKEYDIDS